MFSGEVFYFSEIHVEIVELHAVGGGFARRGFFGVNACAGGFEGFPVTHA